MATSIGTLVGYLVLEDKLSPALKVAQAHIAQTSKSLKDMGTSIQSAGTAMLPLSAAVGGLGAVALATFADFERGMNRVRAISGASGDDFKMLEKQAQDLGAKTVFTARQAADAMGFFALAGFKVNEIYGAMPGALQLAAAGQMDVGAAADIVAKIMRGYAMSAEEVGRINDVLTKSFVSANTDLVMLGEGFKHAGPVAKQFGIEFEEASAVLALMADAGFQASLGGTSFRNALLRLQGVLPESAKLMKQMGLETHTAAGQLRPIADIIEQVEQKGIKAEDMMRLLGVRGGPAMLSVIERGSGELRKFTQMLRDAGGTAERIEKIQLEGLKGAWVIMTSAMEGASIAVGASLAPAATTIVNKLTEVANTVRDDVVPAFEKWPPIARTAVMGVGAAIAAAGPVLIGLGATVKAAGFALEGLGISVAATNKAFLLFGKSIAVVGAAFAGWQAGKWISDMKLFGDEQMSVGESFSFGLLKLQQWAGVLDATDADIEASILAQRNLGQAVQETAAQAEQAAEPIKSAAERVAEAFGEQGQTMMAAEQMVKDYQKQLYNVSQSITDLSDTQREAIQSGLAMGQSTEKVAEALGLAEDVVKAYATGLDEAGKKVDQFIEKQRKSAEETQKLASENLVQLAEATMTTYDARIVAIEEQFKREVAAIESTGAVYEEHYKALRANADAAIEALSSNWDQVRDLSLEALEQQRDAAKNTYDQMLGSGLTFSREVLEGQKQKWKDLEQAVRDYGNHWEGVKDQGGNAIDQMNQKLDQQIDKLGDVKKKIDETFTMDIQPLTRTQIKEIQSQFDPVGAMTGGDPTMALREKLNQLLDLEGTYRPKTKLQYNQMINDQVLLSQLRSMDLSQPEVTQNTVANQVVPTTTGGGISRSTASATSGSSRGLGGGGITMNNYINGTGAQVAQVLSTELMRTLKAGRQFGSA